jgi:hypothetical protein
MELREWYWEMKWPIWRGVMLFAALCFAVWLGFQVSDAVRFHDTGQFEKIPPTGAIP